MTTPLAARLSDIAPFHVMELMKMAAALEAEGRHLIHMGIGEPDFTAPPAVVAAGVKAMTDGRLQYTSALGIPALRAAIAAHYQAQYGVAVAAERIIVTAGASAALLLAAAALVEVRAEVLMPDPCYPCNRHFVAAFDGRAKLVPCGPQQHFQLSDEMVRQHWSDATGGVVLASPSNPTGNSIDAQELSKIITTVRERGGFTIVDEIYQGLSYDRAPFTALALADDVIVINSFSKYFNMTGWRLGWLVVPANLVGEFEKLAQNLFICPSSVAQHAALACFEPATLAVYEERKAEFKRRRDYIVPALRELGFGIPVMPDGAFYVYADCSPFCDDADVFAKQVLNQAGVVIVPGLDFGPATAARYVRFSYANSMENLHEAVARLKAFLQR
ncbi:MULTISPECIES: pyridoxal phosphate-dependent aminotransferase [unclassified Undibacterium]|uniref:pyridoxal phosphate-dependent aminotransferase n=1 Tax=unclassified Undibacterium TaxID=2630295 RepID=UPI002AC91BF6|nr:MULTISPECIES: pyridoxal phosphate-dependent aminotransferase [unclassified Undibacterium]MEB0138323.1 pyridoxal phosphate-dependent aminotransferase [Undibacterium sp. CCC2.1]MEB0172700.1 pyridoxal phosphate-dependent aminotransferase [Undibacterium sp. CCC1.1]MEB0174698.1 pyridoxal phosphate-dependent aminotransferase [Undibacterium sp. CCC3.4]MEB0213895.1 pyridoxal phosphate-dependent aminotransferase [Undibacterium sp. 5I2]WPX42621.1 pyridoxal phosphate-dependent aminotransferase [Undiba